MITICFTYFKSLTLANLSAALYSIRQQELTCVAELVIIDNDTVGSTADIEFVVSSLDFPMPVRIISYKHGDGSKTHAWSTNKAVLEAQTPWVFFSRADYILDQDMLLRLLEVVDQQPANWQGFVTSHGCHLHVDVGEVEAAGWRTNPRVLYNLHGTAFTYTNIDAGVWMLPVKAFKQVGGLCEELTAWGHAQTHFQWKLHQAGVEFVRVPQVLFYHPHHGGERDIEVAHEQLKQQGLEIRDLWARYEGVNPY